MKKYLSIISIPIFLVQGISFGQWKHELDITTPVYDVGLSIDTYVASTDGGCWSTFPSGEKLDWTPRPNFNTYSTNLYGINSTTKNAWGGHVKDSYFNELPMLSELSSLVGAFGKDNFYIGGVYGPAINSEAYAGIHLTNTKNLAFISTTSVLTHNTKQYCTSEKGLYLFDYQDSSWSNTGNLGLTDLYLSTAISYSGRIYGATRDGIWVSNDNGGNWTYSSTGMPQKTFVYCFTSTGNLLIAGTSKGLFGSLDGGKTWNNITNGLRSNFIYSMAINYSGTRLHVGTGSDGVWSLSLADIRNILATENSLAAENIELYPNPTSGNFIVDLSENTEVVTCTIRDVSGKVIYQKIISDHASITLENSQKGMFFVELKSDDYCFNKKLIIE
ncbi:MAG TPA: T9SS type A sorting domain-containing protein [Cytophagaceae bacterium]|jgi:hypothetical protein